MKLWMLRAVMTMSAEPGAPSGPDCGPKFTTFTGPHLAASAYLASKSARPFFAPSEMFGLARSAPVAT